MERIPQEKIAGGLAAYPQRLLEALQRVDPAIDGGLYVVGGAVRDLLLGRACQDIDLALCGDPIPAAKQLIRALGDGTIVDLCDEEQQEACRVVWHGFQVDLASFRHGTVTIEDDLRLRDFSVNAMALRFAEVFAVISNGAERGESVSLHDPQGGAADLQAGIIRYLPGAFVDDPARLVRAYRFAATLGFSLATETEQEVRISRDLIAQVAPERVVAELQLILLTRESGTVFSEMMAHGLLQSILPELCAAGGVEQPEFHHLDVLGHSLLALQLMDRLVDAPLTFYPGLDEQFRSYLSTDKILALKWTALLHDIGKVPARSVRTDGRVTFYSHDEIGREMVRDIGERLRWSKRQTMLVGNLVVAHMHPFHLCNSLRKGDELSKKAALKLCKRVQDDLPGLMLMAMADSLSSKGEKKPPQMEGELVSLFQQVARVYEENIRPVWQGERLLSGHDLISIFQLTPGPMFAKILDHVEMARVEGVVADRQQAIDFVSGYLQREKLR